MAKIVEVDEVELQRSSAARKILEQLAANPQARKKLAEAQKIINPDDPWVKGIEADPNEQRIAALQKELEDFKKSQEERETKKDTETKVAKFAQQREQGIGALRRDGWTDEGIKGVEKIMDEQGILDPAIAAAYFEKMHPPAAPISPTTGSSWNFLDMPKDGADDLKKLIESRGDDDALLNKLVNEALTEVRGQPRR